MPDEDQIRARRRQSGSETRQRRHTVAVRCNDEERAELERRAARSGLSNGEYLRRAGLDAPPLRAVRRPPVEHQTLARILGQLGKCGSNINQIARAVNSGESVQEGPLADALADLAQMRAAIIDTLGLGDRTG